MPNLMLQAKNRGFACTADEVRAVATPAATGTHQPVAHADLIDEVIRTASYSGITLKPEEAKYAVTADGNRMFGIMPAVLNHLEQPDWEFSLGIRNSHDKTFPVGLVVGQRVFICDNLAFSGEVQARTKHSRHVYSRLGRVATNLCARWVERAMGLVEQTEKLKATALSDQDLEHLVLEAIRRDVVGARQIKPLLTEVAKPQNGFDPTTAWGFKNCVTQVLKASAPETLRLQSFKLETLLQEMIHTASYN